MRQLENMAQAGNSGCVAVQSLHRAHSPVTWQPSDQDLQRAEGSSRILLSGSENGTRIKELFQRSPLRIMFPSTVAGTVEEAVLVNTAGGIAGGDRLEWPKKSTGR